VGLCPGSVTLDNKGTYTPNKTQRWLWSYWRECWQEAGQYTQDAEEVIWIMNGDLVDADHKNRSYQYVTGNKATIQSMAIDVIAPGLEIANKVLVIRGTEAHTGTNGEMEELLAKDIANAVVDNDGKTASWYNYRGVLDGLRIDVAHHTSMGGLAWTEKNAANKVAADAIMQYTLVGNKIPNLVVRSHVHRTADSYDNYPTRAVILPAWQSMTSYGARLNPNRLSDVGMVMLMIDDGKIVGEKKMIEKLHQVTRTLWTNQL
jgi:hypothetical protein